MERTIAMLIITFGTAYVHATAAYSPTYEFGSPYTFSVSDDGRVLTLSGSLSWAVPQSLEAVLASSPGVSVISLDSPGGQVLAGVGIAEIIRQRDLATYVGHFCASACTIAFLGGTARWLGPAGWLGFHQAHAPGASTEAADGVLRQSYMAFHLPPQFIAHVLRVPANDLWFPSPTELRNAAIVTGSPPAYLIAGESALPPSLTDYVPLVRLASNDSVIQFSRVLLDLLSKLNATSPEVCWAFAHQGMADLSRFTSPADIAELVAATERMAKDSRDGQTVVGGADHPKTATTDVLQILREMGKEYALRDMQAAADHLAFCSALMDVLQAALSLPGEQRISVLRLLLSGR